ncbi:DUF2490 domain-containing protein [Salinimicrobium sp. HB62]|uniref:DUF2490 domain-containing protein n=1 Tax=Salinimicrobium sp. HB62 TaxID=3077781 RepID=UPI002D783526|nr:DUF2490 domain-containing protein [Salinimicrobium sp. HB62]
MIQKWHFSILILTCLLLGSSANAQTPKAYLWETEFDLELPSRGNWGFTFGAGSRYLFAAEVEGETVKENIQQHLELNHFTAYNSSESLTISLGLRYRFREVFEEALQDEIRIIEQLEYSHLNAFLSPEHRIRFEQRFREATIFRLRYQFGVSQPLSPDSSLGLSTEFLYSMANDNRPKIEQRFGLELENSSVRNLELSLGVEYRRDDLTGFPGTEIFLITGAVLQL